GIRYKENIPDDVQIEDNIPSDDEDNVQTEYYDDEFNKNLIQNLSQNENNDRDSMFFIMNSPSTNSMLQYMASIKHQKVKALKF
ncbi:956_t:CDS:2, partial [Scutellospora calospora]